MQENEIFGLSEISGKNEKEEEENKDDIFILKKQNGIDLKSDDVFDEKEEMNLIKKFWIYYDKSEEKDHLILNGIVHKCNNLLIHIYTNKNVKISETFSPNTDKPEKKNTFKIPEEFYEIYALSLSELSKYYANDVQKLRDFYKESIYRVDSGLEIFKDSKLLFLTKSYILLERILMDRIPEIKNTKHGDYDESLVKLIDDVIFNYENSFTKPLKSDSDNFFKNISRVLFLFDDLIEILLNDNINDYSSESDISDHDTSQNENALLISTTAFNKYKSWWKEEMILFLKLITSHFKKLGIILNNEFKLDYNKYNQCSDTIFFYNMYFDVCKRLGYSYLEEAETISKVYFSLLYDEKNEDNNFTGDSLKNDSIDLLKTSIKYFNLAKKNDDPETWIPISESLLALGNLYEIGSQEQEDLYQQSKEILNKVNNATNGKYNFMLKEELKNL